MGKSHIATRRLRKRQAARRKAGKPNPLRARRSTSETTGRRRTKTGGTRAKSARRRYRGENLGPNPRKYLDKGDTYEHPTEKSKTGKPRRYRIMSKSGAILNKKSGKISHRPTRATPAPTRRRARKPKSSIPSRTSRRRAGNVMQA